nr:hypothetical protein [Paenibacillus etheri]
MPTGSPVNSLLLSSSWTFNRGVSSTSAERSSSAGNLRSIGFIRVLIINDKY